MKISNETVHPLTQALQDAGVRLVIESRPTTLTTTKDGWKCYEWTVRILCDGRETPPIPYKMGAAHVGKDKKPRAPKPEDVAHSLAMDASCAHESFADWCDILGYGRATQRTRLHKGPTSRSKDRRQKPAVRPANRQGLRFGTIPDSRRIQLPCAHHPIRQHGADVTLRP